MQRSNVGAFYPQGCGPVEQNCGAAFVPRHATTGGSANVLRY
jgi:hypothetical protein